MVTKKKKNEATPPTPKSRAKYRCPPELEELICQVNLVPPDFSLVTVLFEYENKRDVEDEENIAVLNDQSSDEEVLEKALKDTPEKFQRHIESVASKRLDILGINERGDKLIAFQDHFLFKKIQAYREYCDTRISMFGLVRRIKKEGQKRQLSEKYGDLSSYEFFSQPITTVVKRDDAGILHLTGLAALIGKFDDSRLRDCEICRRIFWAKRDNSKTCSPRCLNVLNVRNSRSLTDEEKAARKAKREANQELIKKGKVKPTKRNK